MRLVFKAVILSIFLHITYLVVILGWSYLKTLYYTPDFSAANTVILQNEVSFGYVGSAQPLIVSFIVIALVTWVILRLAETKKVINE